MKAAVMGLILVLASVAWRILGWPAGIEAFLVWLFYVVGALLVARYFVDGPKRRQWVAAPVILALVILPRAITWIVHR